MATETVIEPAATGADVEHSLRSLSMMTVEPKRGETLDYKSGELARATASAQGLMVATPVGRRPHGHLSSLLTDRCIARERSSRHDRGHWIHLKPASLGAGYGCLVSRRR